MITPEFDSSLLEHKAYAFQHKYGAYQSELDVIEKLHRLGIFAQPGRVTHYKYADVVAWGCVLIEIRTANIDSDNSYKWRIRAARMKADVIRGHLAIFAAIDADGSTSHYVFPTNHSCFFIDGKMKTAAKYTPGATQSPRTLAYNPFTDAIMTEHRDRWDLIELARQHIGRSYSIDAIRKSLVVSEPKPRKAGKKAA